MVDLTRLICINCPHERREHDEKNNRCFGVQGDGTDGACPCHRYIVRIGRVKKI